MKNQIFIFALFLVSLQCFSQTPAWSWAQNAGGAEGDWSYAVKTDENGNVYVAGSFKSATITFGTFTLANTAVGSNDLFLVKYDTDKNVLWAISNGGSGSDVATAIDVDESGNVYLGGYFSSPTINFGGGIIITRTGGSDAFFVKYNSTGMAVWAKKGGGSSNEEVEDITVDLNGNLFGTGYFESASCIFGTITLTNHGHYDGFLVKYDISGNEISANGYGGSMWDDCKGIISDNSGNVYLTGYYRSDITFGDTTLFNSTGDAHLFVVKYDNSGEYLWAKNSAGTWEIGNEIALDQSGDIYITGFFQGTTMSSGNLLLSNNGPSGTSDFFILKYNQDGNPQWLTGGGNSEYEEGRAVDIDHNGDVVAGVYFNSSTITIGSSTIVNNGAGDILLIKYLNIGNFSWVLHAGGDADDQIHSLSAGNQGENYICGSFSSSTLSFGTETLTNTGVADMFVAEADDFLTDIRPEIQASEAIVFPNPASEFITIKTNRSMTGKVYFLVNAMGARVCRGIIKGEPVFMDIRILNDGLYHLVFPDDEGMNTKFMKM
jgi:hypothetical protein